MSDASSSSASVVAPPPQPRVDVEQGVKVVLVASDDTRVPISWEILTEVDEEGKIMPHASRYLRDMMEVVYV